MVDLKMLGRSLAESGLMGRSFAAMSEAEVRQVARMILDHSKKRCILCDQWEKVPEAPWWIGRCRIGGHGINRDSFCTLITDEPPF